MAETGGVVLVAGPEIAAYGFPGGHPFGPDRHDAFMAELSRSDKFSSVARLNPERASREQLEFFHTAAYVDKVVALSKTGSGYLDGGDTPAFEGVFEAASDVVGASLRALQAILTGEVPRAFVPMRLKPTRLKFASSPQIPTPSAELPEITLSRITLSEDRTAIPAPEFPRIT